MPRTGDAESTDEGPKEIGGGGGYVSILIWLTASQVSTYPYPIAHLESVQFVVREKGRGGGEETVAVMLKVA